MNITYVIGTFGCGGPSGYTGDVIRFSLLSLMLGASCADGGIGFFSPSSSWTVESDEVQFGFVAWGENAFAEFSVGNNGESEVVLELLWNDDSEGGFRVMRDQVAVPSNESASVGLAFYTITEELDHQGELLVVEERTGRSVSVWVSATLDEASLPAAP